MDLPLDRLIAVSTAIADRPSVFDQLARVSVRAASDLGVEVTVSLDGMITDLELTPTALSLGAPALCAEIFRLTHQAAGAALAEGLTILEPVAGHDLLALLTPDHPEPAHPDEDFSTVQTWAV